MPSAVMQIEIKGFLANANWSAWPLKYFDYRIALAKYFFNINIGLIKTS
jgi:hypothetical protein